jgi:serine/threonine protein kinase
VAGPTLEAGDPPRISKYELIGRLAESDRRIVYLARTPSADRVAVTRLRAGATTDPALPDRLAEGVVPSHGVAQFSVARVLDAGRDDDGPFIVSEYISGPSLEGAIRGHGPLSGAALDRVAIATATGLRAVHAAGLVHRALRPEHVLLGPSGPRIVGLGIVEEPPIDGPDAARTPYLAPEQIRGEPTGPPADVFSWASTMVFAATGESPFNASNATAQRHQIVHQKPDLIAVPLPLAGVLARCLAKAPQARPTAPDLLLSLLEALHPEPEHEDQAQPPSVARSGDDQVSGPRAPADTPDPSARTPDPHLDPLGSPGADPPPPRRRNRPILAAAVVGAAVVIPVGVTVALRDGLPVERPTITSAATATGPTTAGAAPTSGPTITAPTITAPTITAPTITAPTITAPTPTGPTTAGAALTAGPTPTRAATATGPTPTRAAPSTAPTSGVPPEAPRVPRVPAAFAGTWSGTFHMPSPAPPELLVTLLLTAGSTVGNLRLPTLGCESVLTVTGVSANGRSLEFDERSGNNPNSWCVTSSHLVATLGSAGTLNLSRQDARNPTNPASGQLERQ